MRVVTCDLTATNLLSLDGNDYMTFATPGRSTVVVRGKCPHRGGPLHLGRHDERAGKLVCPWHGLGVPVRKLVADALPAVRRGTTMTIVFDAPPDGPVVTLRRLASPAMSVRTRTAVACPR